MWDSLDLVHQSARWVLVEGDQGALHLHQNGVGQHAQDSVELRQPGKRRQRHPALSCTRPSSSSTVGSATPGGMIPGSE